MSLGLDILDAVSRGGSEKWLPNCERNRKEKAKKTIAAKVLDENLEQIKSFMGTNRYTVAKLALGIGITKDAARHRLETLVRAGEFKRSGTFPYQYWRI